MQVGRTRVEGVEEEEGSPLKKAEWKEGKKKKEIIRESNHFVVHEYTEKKTYPGTFGSLETLVVLYSF